MISGSCVGVPPDDYSGGTGAPCGAGWGYDSGEGTTSVAADVFGADEGRDFLLLEDLVNGGLDTRRGESLLH